MTKKALKISFKGHATMIALPDQGNPASSYHQSYIHLPCSTADTAEASRAL